MRLEEHEKCALRDQAGLPFGSGQFPLTRRRPSGKRALGGALMWALGLCGALLALTAFAIWMRG